MSEWQPIETAPKGNKLLLYGPDFYGYVSYDIHEVDGFQNPTYWKLQGYTHWMPLPEPPK